MKNNKSRTLKKPVLIFGVILSIILSVILVVPLQTIGTSTSNSAMYGTLTGIVTDAETDEPLASALMTLKYHDLIRTDLTDSDGEYTFDNVPICFCLKNISAAKLGYESEYQLVGVSEITYVNFSLTPTSDTPPDDEEPEEPPEDDDPEEPPEEPPDDEEPPEDDDDLWGIITGIVLDAKTNLPISGALVTLKCHDELRTQYTNSDGEYTFDNVPICFCLKNVSVDKNGYGSEYQLVGVHEITYVNFTLEPASSTEINPPVSNPNANPQDITSRSNDRDDLFEPTFNNFLILILIGILIFVLIIGLIHYVIKKELRKN